LQTARYAKQVVIFQKTVQNIDIVTTEHYHEVP